MIKINDVEKVLKGWNVNVIPAADPLFWDKKTKKIFLEVRDPKAEVSCEEGTIYIFCKDDDVKYVNSVKNRIVKSLAKRLWRLSITNNLEKELEYCFCI